MLHYPEPEKKTHAQNDVFPEELMNAIVEMYRYLIEMSHLCSSKLGRIIKNLIAVLGFGLNFANWMWQCWFFCGTQKLNLAVMYDPG